MMPMVFCASLVPWPILEKMEAISWRVLNMGPFFAGWDFLKIQMVRMVITAAPRPPTIGAIKIKRNI